jgi:[ribosomal protein S5]-alanine N-acetyltransferase
VILRGENIRLRPIKNSDLEALYKLVDESESWGDFEPFVLVDWFTFESNRLQRGTIPSAETLFLIESRDKSIPGAIFYRESHLTMRNTEIGYAVFEKKSRGKGIASEAARLLVDYLFSNKPVERIEARTHIDNIGARRVLEKRGFKLEGTMRKASFANGVFRDCNLYSILREEWKQGQRFPIRISPRSLDPDLRLADLNLPARRFHQQ